MQSKITWAIAALGVAGLAASHQAAAQIATSTGGNSDLIFVAVDPTTGESFYDNLGVLSLPASGLATTIPASVSFSSNSLFTQFRSDTSADSSSILYAVIGGGIKGGAANPVGANSFDSTVGGTGAPSALSNSQLSQFVLMDTNIVGPLNGLNGTSQNSGNGYLVSNSTAATAPQYNAASGLWTWNGNASFSTPATVNTQNALYNFTATKGTGNTGATTATLIGDFSFNGTALSFTPAGSQAVPLPAAVWLLGSGLFGLMGISRRRSSAA